MKASEHHRACYENAKGAGLIVGRGFVCPKAVCADGFEISIQASSAHYCFPRETGSDIYMNYELGFPSCKDDLIASYAEDPGNPTETIYPMVPADVVEKLVEKHGGIVTCI